MIKFFNGMNIITWIIHRMFSIILSVGKIVFDALFMDFLS